MEKDLATVDKDKKSERLKRLHQLRLRQVSFILGEKIFRKQANLSILNNSLFFQRMKRVN